MIKKIALVPILMVCVSLVACDQPTPTPIAKENVALVTYDVTGMT